MALTSEQADGEVTLFMQLSAGPRSVWKSLQGILISDATSVKHLDRHIVHRESLAVTFKAKISHARDWALHIRVIFVACLKSLAQRDRKVCLGFKGRS